MLLTTNAGFLRRRRAASPVRLFVAYSDGFERTASLRRSGRRTHKKLGGYPPCFASYRDTRRINPDFRILGDAAAHCTRVNSHDSASVVLGGWSRLPSNHQCLPLGRGFQHWSFPRRAAVRRNRPNGAAHLPVVMTDLPVALLSTTAVVRAARAFREWIWTGLALVNQSFHCRLASVFSRDFQAFVTLSWYLQPPSRRYEKNTPSGDVSGSAIAQTIGRQTDIFKRRKDFEWRSGYRGFGRQFAMTSPAPGGDLKEEPL